MIAVVPALTDCEEITFNAETAEAAEKFLMLSKATTKARRHEGTKKANGLFVFSCLRGCMFP